MSKTTSKQTLAQKSKPARVGPALRNYMISVLTQLLERLTPSEPSNGYECINAGIYLEISPNTLTPPPLVAPRLVGFYRQYGQMNPAWAAEADLHAATAHMLLIGDYFILPDALTPEEVDADFLHAYLTHRKRYARDYRDGFAD